MRYIVALLLKNCIGYIVTRCWGKEVAEAPVLKLLCSVASTLVGCKLLAELSGLEAKDFFTSDRAVDAMINASSLFDLDAVGGEDYDKSDIFLIDAVNFL